MSKRGCSDLKTDYDSHRFAGLVKLADTRDFIRKEVFYSMLVYEDYKCYGPYTRSDGRQHVVLVHHDNEGSIDNRLTCSYPKYIVERHIGRKLKSSETIDHIDGNFSNNNLSNLRIIERSLHCRSHTDQRKVIEKQCNICGKVFYTDNNSRVTCGSKSCRGYCAHVIGHNKGNNFIRKMNEYTSLRSLVQEIVSVEGANSGKSLVDNPEQD